MTTHKQLDPEDFRYINAIMCNNEYSTNEELVDLFKEELAISEKLALQIVSYRDRALVELDFDIEYYLEGGK